MTTRECVHVDTQGHFQSHDKDGGHTIRRSRQAMLHANFTAACSIELELLPIEVLHCGNRMLDLLSSCDLDLDPMTFIYELDPFSLEMSRICEYERTYVKAFESYRLTEADIQTQLTDRHNRYDIPRRFGGGQKLYTE